MAKTVGALYTRALQLLTVAAAGQTPDAEDLDIVRTMLPALLAELLALNAANISITPDDDSAEDIPDECFDPLAVILANDAGPAFGIPMANGEARNALIMRLRAVTYGAPQGYTQDAEYF